MFENQSILSGVVGALSIEPTFKAAAGIIVADLNGNSEDFGSITAGKSADIIARMRTAMKAAKVSGE